MSLPINTCRLSKLHEYKLKRTFYGHNTSVGEVDVAKILSIIFICIVTDMVCFYKFIDKPHDHMLYIYSAI